MFPLHWVAKILHANHVVSFLRYDIPFSHKTCVTNDRETDDRRVSSC